MKPTKTEQITKYRRPKMRTKQATDGARDDAAEASRFKHLVLSEAGREKGIKT